MGRIGDFPLEAYSPLGDTFELKNRQIENQQNSEECFLFALTNYLQVANSNIRAHSISPRISGPYLATVKLLEYIEQALRTDNTRLHASGGNIPDAIEVTLKYGFVPDDVWRPRVPFQKWPFPQLYEEIERALKTQTKNLQKVAEISGGLDSPEYQKALLAAIAVCQDVVLRWSGPLPVRFDWQNRSWTPKRFSQVYGLKQAREFQLFSPLNRELYDDEDNLRNQMNSTLKAFGGDFSIYRRNWDQIEGQILESLHRGVPVLVGVHWGRTGHVMNVVGYEIRNERVFAWKFLNSWGRFTPSGETYYRASDVRNKADQIWIIE